MVGPDIDEGGGPDNPCATCGHAGRAHIVREIEEAGKTVRETYCEGCGALCEFVPVTE
jgi:MinD superfamily P-loop ATPase